MNNPTIAAISTPMSAGAIGLVRMSGPDAKAIAASVFRPIGKRSHPECPRFFRHLWSCDGRLRTGG